MFHEFHSVGAWRASIRGESDDFERSHLLLAVGAHRNVVVLFAELVFEIVLLHSSAANVETVAPPSELDPLLLSVFHERVQFGVVRILIALGHLQLVIQKVMLVRHRKLEHLAVLVWHENFRFAHDDVVRIEVLVIDADLLHLMLKKINFDVIFMGESLVAHGAARNFDQPIVDAISMENVEAGEHAAVRLVHDRIEADDALRNEVFPVLHSYKGRFDFLVGRLREAALNFEMRPSDSLDKRVLGLVVPPTRSVHLSVVDSIVRVFRHLARVVVSCLSVVLIEHVSHPIQSIVVEFPEPLSKEGLEEEYEDQDDKSDEDDANNLCYNESGRLR